MIVAYSIGLIWLTWILYVAVMALKRCRDAGQLTMAMKVLGYPVLGIGLVCDCLLNVTVCTVVFLDLPRELLVTARLKRMVNFGKGWRRDLAIWFAVNLLDALDPSGKHV